MTIVRGVSIVSVIACLFLLPNAAGAQVSAQAVSQGDCGEMCVDVTDSEGNVVGGACMDYGPGNGMGHDCRGSIANGCSLGVYCLPPIGRGTLQTQDGSQATPCLRVLPEITIAGVLREFRVPIKIFALGSVNDIS
jgi:hypothetical protein